MLLAVLLSLSLVQDQPEVRALLSSPSVRVGESVTLSVIVEARSQSFRRGGDQEPIVRPPRLPDGLKIIARQQSSQQTFAMPGGRTYTVRHDIAIVPSRSGTFEIPPVEALIGGRSYRSGSLYLTVSANVRPRASDGASDAGARLLVALSPDTAYVGQQLTLSGELLVGSEAQLRATRTPAFQAPAPRDFWVQEIPTTPAGELRTLNGENYMAYGFQRAYFPLTPGTYQFAPIQVTYTARQGFLMLPETRELAASPPSITVLPVPESGRPAEFNGAVGRYAMSVDVQPRTITAGDALSLTVRITGAGNIKTLPAPALPAMDRIEALTPSEMSETTVDGSTVGGVKTFTWVLIPERAGRQLIPSVRYVFFDPEAGSYSVLESDPIEVRVTPDKPAARTAAPGIRPLRLRQQGNSLEWVRTPWFLVAQFLPPLFAIGWIVRRRRAPYVAVSQARTRCLRGLDALEKHLAATDFHDQVARFLRDCISQVLGVDVRAATSATIGQHLTHVLSQSQVEALTDLLRELENARYAARSSSGQERRALLARVRSFVRSLPQTPRATRASMFVLGLLLVQQPSFFEQGVNAFQDGRTAESVNAFRAYVAEAPEDPSGWYNLGNAYARAGDHALATWAWLNTVALQPRASDAVRNLEVVRAGSVIERVRPAARLSGREVLLFCAVAWWLAWGFFYLAARRSRRSNIFAGLVLLALAGGLLAARAIERVLPRAGVVHGTGVQGRTEPSLRAETTLPLRRGSTVAIVQRRGEWLLVQSAEGPQVWIERDAVLLVARPRL